jgi:protein SCO1/2
MKIFGAMALGILTAIGVDAIHAAPAFDPAALAYHERIGQRVPMDAEFRDADGRAVKLAALSRGMPLVLIPAYFRCTNLCGVVRASFYGALRSGGLQAGRDFAVAVLSIDPTETRGDAHAAQTGDAAAFGAAAGGGWNYLTGSPAAVAAVMDAVGFRYRRDTATRQFVHPAGLVFLSPEGVVSSYLLGVGFRSAQIRSALQRAAAGRVGVEDSPLLLLCFHFDETTGHYSLAIMKLVRLAAILTLIAIAGTVLWLSRRRGGRA